MHLDPLQQGKHSPVRGRGGNINTRSKTLHWADTHTPPSVCERVYERVYERVNVNIVERLGVATG